MTDLRIAFLFLVRDSPHPMWYSFFPDPLPPNISLFIHSKKPMCKISSRDRFKPHYDTSPVETDWADKSQIVAIDRLFKRAFLHPSKPQLFFHASESCLPLVTLSRFIAYLGNYNNYNYYPKGFLLHRLESSRYNSRLEGYIARNQFRKMRAQGWVFPREMVSILVWQDTLATDLEYFSQTLCPTEHVLVNILLHYGVSLDQYFCNRPLTYFNWNDSPETKHPLTYQPSMVTRHLVSDLVDRNYLCLRKATPQVRIKLITSTHKNTQPSQPSQPSLQIKSFLDSYITSI